MTVVNPKSISGINSITTGSGSDNLLTIHTSDASSTERVRINSSGDVIVGSGITVSPDGDIFATGVTTSTTFVGALTGNVTGNINGNLTGTLQTAAQTNITSVGSLSSLVVTGGITATGGNIVMNDSSGSSANRIKLGTSQDLEIYHDANHSRIVDSGTGSLRIQSNDARIINAAGSEDMARFIENGAVELYHNNVKKFETHDVGTIFTEAGSGVTQGAIKVNTTLDNYGSITVRDKTDVGDAISAFQVENAGNGTNETNLLLRSVNLGTTAFAHGIYAARSHRFAVSSNTTPTVQIDSDGLKFNNDQASANALDDYEEGNFSIGVTDSNSTFSTGQESGKYIKIGHVVHCTFIINCTISGTSGYAFFLTGFPFTVKNYGSHANEGLGTCKGTGQEIQLEAQQDNTTVKARNPSSGSSMSVNDIGCTNNTVKSIRGYIIYQTT